MIYFLLLLAIVPLSTYYLANMHNPSLKWRLTGVGFGAVIAPLSFCLLKSAYIPFVGKILGLFGLFFNLIHGSVGYFMVVGMGFQEPDLILSLSGLTLTNLFNAVIWGSFYGIVGANIDQKLTEEEGVRGFDFEAHKQKARA